MFSYSLPGTIIFALSWAQWDYVAVTPVTQVCVSPQTRQGRSLILLLPFRTTNFVRVYFPAPKPVACMAFFDRSLVEEMPCMRSLKSSAFDAFSSAVSYPT